MNCEMIRLSQWTELERQRSWPNFGYCLCRWQAGVSGFFIDIKSFRSHYGPGVGSASNRNEYQEYFLGVKAAGA